LALREIWYKNSSFLISYERRGRGEPIILLHGWGSSKEVMLQAFKDCKEFELIAIDMPGFGKSPNNMVLNTRDYAAIVEIFLKELNIPKNIIVGHSFGGKVATLLEPKLLVLLSSAGIPEPKSFIVRAKIALYKALKPFGVAKLRQFFVASDAKGMSDVMYATFKNVVDEDFSSVFASFKNFALIFWGEEDRATSLKSGQKIATLIKRSKFYPLPGGHYFFLDHSREICQKIKEIYEKL